MQPLPAPRLADHEHPPRLLRRGDHAARVGHGGRHWFLAQHVAAGLQRRAGHRAVRLGHGQVNHEIRRDLFQHRGEIRARRRIELELRHAAPGALEVEINDTRDGYLLQFQDWKPRAGNSAGAYNHYSFACHMLLLYADCMDYMDLMD